MSDAYTHKPIDEMETIWKGSYFRARGALGIDAFGLGVLDLPPNFDRMPRHVHTFDHQEEVYIPLRGSGWLDVGGERIPIDDAVAVRVGPTASRTIISGPDGIRVLIAGGVPGKAYEPFAPLEVGAAEPNPADLPGIKADALHESTEDYTAVPVEGCGAIRGMIPGITFYPLGRSLGISAFGLAELKLEFNGGESGYPLHTHDRDNQTEVYVVQEGSGRIEIDGEAVEAKVGEMVAVGPGPARKWFANEDGLRLIALGAPAGAPYEGNVPTQL
ncbi:MAG: cupin domain-containing protein [Solirubrobacterales bacterium]